MIFNRVFEMTPFLNSYADLKPQMLLQESHSRFRIVVQCFNFKSHLNERSSIGSSEYPSLQQQFSDLR